MPGAFITQLATLAESVSGTTHTFTLGASVAIGDLLFIGTGMTSASTTFGTPTDTGGNTWQAGTTINTSTPSLGAKTADFCCVATGAMIATNTVQFTTSASTRGAGYLVSFSGSSGSTATVADVGTTTGSGATGTAVSIGPTATTAGADIVIGIAGWTTGAGTVAAGTGYTISTTDHVSSNNGYSISLVYKIAAGAAAETALMTLPVSSGWQGIIRTFKVAAAGGATVKQLAQLGVG